MLNLKIYSTTKRYLTETGLAVEEVLVLPEKEISGTSVDRQKNKLKLMMALKADKDGKFGGRCTMEKKSFIG